MKRVCRFFLLSLLLFVFQAFSLTAQSKVQSINFFTPEKPVITAQWGIAFPFKCDLRNPSPSEDFIISADCKELRFNAGIKYQAEQLDFTNNLYYMPTFNKAFQAGLGLTWHFYRYFESFTENDLIVTTRFRWIKGPVFSFENGVGFLFKYASIDAVKESKPLIFNFSYNFDLSFNWKLFQKANLWCAIKFQDYFDYPLAISPFYKMGFEFHPDSALIFGLDYSLKFVDMFFSAVYLNESILHLFMKVVL